MMRLPLEWRTSMRGWRRGSTRLIMQVWWGLPVMRCGPRKPVRIRHMRNPSRTVLWKIWRICISYLSTRQIMKCLWLRRKKMPLQRLQHSLMKIIRTKRRKPYPDTARILRNSSDLQRYRQRWTARWERKYLTKKLHRKQCNTSFSHIRLRMTPVIPQSLLMKRKRAWRQMPSHLWTE